MNYTLYRLIVEIRTAVKAGASLSVNDLAFIDTWKVVDEAHYTDVSEDDAKRIKAIHKHVWPTLVQGDA